MTYEVLWHARAVRQLLDLHWHVATSRSLLMPARRNRTPHRAALLERCLLRCDGSSRRRSLFDAMPQLGWVANADGFITYYNRRWYEYTGKTAPEAGVGSPCTTQMSCPRSSIGGAPR